MTRYRVYETVCYSVEASSEEEAVLIIQESHDRDEYVVEVEDRHAVAEDDVVDEPAS